MLRVAAADIAGTLPVMKVSDHLTRLAEAIIDAVVHRAWVQMVARYGQPKHLADREGRGFAVVGYGKLGGWELGYSSDLDLIFLHDCPADVMTDGEREIDGRQFYLRWPSASCTCSAPAPHPAFCMKWMRVCARPARQACWSPRRRLSPTIRRTKPDVGHQALVRARVVYGDPQLKTQFDAIRKAVMTTRARAVRCKPKCGKCGRRCARTLATNIAIALISKPMKAGLPILSLSLSTGAAARAR